MMNSCSTKVQFDELSEIMRNYHMKHITVKVINSAYTRSKYIALFGEDETNKRNINRHRFSHERESKN